MSSSNLVQELVQEMGPYNPALNFNTGMPMDSQGYNPQQQMHQMQQMQQMPQMQQQMPQMYQPSNQGPDMMQPNPGMQSGMQTGQGRPYMQQLPPAPEGYDMDDEDQMQEMMDLEHFGMDGGHRSFSDRAMDQGREGLFLAIVFVLLSLPQTDRFIQRTIPQVTSKFYYLLAFKGALLAIAFFFAKYFELI